MAPRSLDGAKDCESVRPSHYDREYTSAVAEEAGKKLGGLKFELVILNC